MLTATVRSQDFCVECASALSPSLRHCPTCRTDAGAPNVRLSRKTENKQKLDERYKSAQARAYSTGKRNEFDKLEEIVKNKSGVVIALPAGIARKLLEDASALYSSYENMVGSGIRLPAQIEHDRQRIGVGGVLFGSYANKIVYGALSLTENGLPTYGEVFCKIRSVAINKRTDFLEVNSFKFVEDHGLVPGSKIPCGYNSCWEDRHYLVLSKMADSLMVGQTEKDWQEILVYSDGQDRHRDEFVEAHIFEGFDRNAIDTMVESVGKKLNRSEKLDLDIAIELFNCFKGKAI